jgi:hypothetical protein
MEEAPMTCGILVNGSNPRTKRAVRDAVARDPDKVVLVATSAFGGEHDGPITRMQPGQKEYFVGPDPWQARNWYGSITKRADGTFKIE